MWIKDFVRKHPEAIVSPRVPLAELVDDLKQKYGAAEIPAAEIPNLFMHRFNALHLPANEALGLTEDHLQIKAVRIPVCGATGHFTVRDYVPQQPEDFIYLAYEEAVGYLYSNSSRLFLEVILARGLSPEEVEADGEEYICYLSYLQRYLEYVHPELAEE